MTKVSASSAGEMGRDFCHPPSVLLKISRLLNNDIYLIDIVSIKSK